MGPGSSRAFLCSLVLTEPYFKHSDTKWDETKQNIVDQILGGRLLRPPLDPPLLT